jgi:hypothetical protein
MSELQEHSLNICEYGKWAKRLSESLPTWLGTTFDIISNCWGHTIDSSVFDDISCVCVGGVGHLNCKKGVKIIYCGN